MRVRMQDAVDVGVGTYGSTLGGHGEPWGSGVAAAFCGRLENEANAIASAQTTHPALAIAFASFPS